MTFSVSFSCLVLLNDFAVSTYFWKLNMRRYVRKVCFQTSRFKISIGIWLSVQYRHWYVVLTRMRTQMDGLCKVLFLLTRVQILMDVLIQMDFVLSSFWINYDWFILVRYVNEEKYMCLEEDEFGQLQDKHYDFGCLYSNNGIFWMVNCTFHIDHGMLLFAFVLMGKIRYWWFWLSVIRRHVQYRNIVLVIRQFFFRRIVKQRQLLWIV